MKVCSKCSNEYDESLESCPFCGFAEEAETDSVQPVEQNYEPNNASQVNFCQYCGNPVEPNSVFCPNCGSKLVGGVPNNTMNTQFKQRVQNNEFVQSFRDDINNSKSIGMIKEKAQYTAAKAKTLNPGQVKVIIIAAVIVFVIALGAIIGTNIHTCDECQKTYLGKKYTISFWGQREDICKECYTDLFGD